MCSLPCRLGCRMLERGVMMVYLMACAAKRIRKGRLRQRTHLSAHSTKDKAWLSDTEGGI